MNLPNKLTILRILVIPFMVVVNYISYLREYQVTEFMSLANVIMLIIFILASFTDFLDGHIARKNNLVTTFGKFMDPLADKILTSAALIILLEQGIVPGWCITVILAREFMVSGVRLLAVEEGKVIAANKLGKIKTVSQIVAICILFIGGPLMTLGMIALYFSVFMTIVSGYEYLSKNIDVVLKSK